MCIFHPQETLFYYAEMCIASQYIGHPHINPVVRIILSLTWPKPFLWHINKCCHQDLLVRKYTLGCSDIHNMLYITCYSLLEGWSHFLVICDITRTHQVKTEQDRKQTNKQAVY